MLYNYLGDIFRCFSCSTNLVRYSSYTTYNLILSEELGQSLGGPTPEHQSSPLALSLGLDTPPTDRDDDSKSMSSEISVGSEGSHHRYIEVRQIKKELTFLGYETFSDQVQLFLFLTRPMLRPLS